MRYQTFSYSRSMTPLARHRLALTLPPLLLVLASVGGWGCSSSSGGNGSGGSNAGTGGAVSGSGGASSGSGGASSGSGGASSGSGGAAADGKFAPCTAATRLGSLTLTLVHAVAATTEGSATPAHAQFGGAIYDRVRPDTVWPEVDHEGDCRVVVGPDLVCANPCAATEECAGNNVCQPKPKAQGAGVASVSGLTPPLASTPSKSNVYYETFPSEGAYPPFTPGGTLSLSTAGDAVPAFHLAARGIAPLELPASQTPMLAKDKPLMLTWTPAPAGTSGRITVSMDIGHHNGITAANLNCDFPDTGSATIPGKLITTLISKGFAGFPDMEIARVSVDSTTVGAGCVEWMVTAPLKVPLSLEGVTSCHEDTDCPKSAPVCHADLTCGT